MQWPHIMSGIFLSFGILLLWGYVTKGWFRTPPTPPPPPPTGTKAKTDDDPCGPLRARINDLEAENFDLMNKLLKAEGEIWRLAEELKKALEEAAMWQEKYNDALRRIAALEEEIRRLLGELGSCRAKLSEALSTCAAKDAVKNACTFDSSNWLR
jgi:hypothetical protein